MLNKAIEPLKSESVFSKNERNRKIFKTGEFLMLASIEISPLSPELGKIIYAIGNNILEEIDLSDDKMTEDEINNIINDILSIPLNTMEKE